MVTLGQLLEYQVNGALSVEYNKDIPNPQVGTLGGVQITKEQAFNFCVNKLGWTTFVVNPFEAIHKVSKYVKMIKPYLEDDYVWDNTVVTFMNKRDTEYGKTFDRITFTCAGCFDYTLICGMKNAGGKIVLYQNGFANPLDKLKSFKQFALILNNRGRR